MNLYTVKRYLPLMIALIHTLLVVGMAANVRSSTLLKAGDGSAMWMSFLIIDFPSSLLVLLAHLVHGIDTYNMVVYGDGILFGIIGGCQYYFLAWILSRYIQRRRRKRGELQAGR